MQVTYTEDGVDYTAENGVTMHVFGKQRCGEVFLDHSFYAYYEHTATGKVQVIADDDTVLGEFETAGWEEFALDVIGG